MSLTRFFSAIRGRLGARRSLRELQALERAEATRLLDDPEQNPVNLARTCLRDGDPDGARRLWKDALARYPKYVERSHDALRLALDLGFLDEAEAMATRSQKWKPSDGVYFEVAADAVDRRGDIAGALIMWNRIRRRFSNRPQAWLRAAFCLSRLGRDPEGEVLLRQAVGKFPDARECYVDYARSAERREQWSEALERWDALEARFPAVFEGPFGAAHALERMGRGDEAEARLRAVRHRHTSDPAMAIQLARHAIRRGAWEEAVAASAAIRERWPDRPEGYQAGVDALFAMGRHAESEELRARIP